MKVDLLNIIILIYQNCSVGRQSSAAEDGFKVALSHFSLFLEFRKKYSNWGLSGISNNGI